MWMVEVHLWIDPFIILTNILLTKLENIEIIIELCTQASTYDFRLRFGQTKQKM